MTILKFNKAFTLAEIIITLTLLGIVAAITVPATLNKSSQKAQKTKIRKAMSTYDKTVQNILIVEDLQRSESALKSYMSDDDCRNAARYFKISKKETEDSYCRFKANDGLWWDIEDITNTIVSFEQEDLNEVTANSNEYKAFKFVTTFDEQGNLRINDMGFAENGTTFNVALIYKAAITKVTKYLDDKTYYADLIAKYSSRCSAKNNYKSCTMLAYTPSGYYSGPGYWMLDENGKYIVYAWKCKEGTIDCKMQSVNGIYLPREDGLYHDNRECDSTFTKCGWKNLQTKDGDKVTCSCNGCEGQTYSGWPTAKYTDSTGAEKKLNGSSCPANRSCVSCSGTGCPARSAEDGCFHL